MGFFTGLLCLAAFLYLTGAQDVVCSRKTSKTVQVEVGESFSFKTQAGRKYRPNTKCVVRYKKSLTCSSLRFSCSKFSVKNKKSSCTQKGDRMVVVADGKAKRFCQRNPPNITTSEDLKVVFLSNKGGQSSGAECLVQCQEANATTGPITCPGCPSEAQVSPLIQSLANFAANNNQFPLLPSPSCGQDLKVKVVDAASQVVAGTNYILTLEVSVLVGANCDQVKTSICSNVVVFRPLPFLCQGDVGCDQLSRPEGITCRVVGVEQVPSPALVDPSSSHQDPPSASACICPALFAPVCAENGKTYSNACSAKCQGVKAICEGACPCI